MPPKTKNIKERLIDETIRQIDVIGPEKLSLRKIATECGVTHATAYKYFENKQDLINVCRQYVGNRLLAYIRRHARGAEEPYVAITKAYLRYMILHPQYHYLIHLCPLTKNTDVSEANVKMRDRYQANWDIITDYLRRCGIAEEAFPNTLILVSTILNGLVSLLNRRAISYVGNDPTDLVDILIFDPLDLYPKK